jgi:SIR2-like domain
VILIRASDVIGSETASADLAERFHCVHATFLNGLSRLVTGSDRDGPYAGREMLEPDLRNLQASLTRALELSAALEQEPRENTQGRYLEDEHLLAAIDRVANHDGQIAIIVGAGASIEAGLPSWAELVDALLKPTADRLGVPEDQRDAWVTEVLAEGLPAAAAVVEAGLADGTDFQNLLWSALYRGRPAASFPPGALAQQIAWAKRRLGSDLRIITGNYDGLLEDALREEGVKFASYVQGRTEPTGTAAVYHLHGRLIPDYRDRPGKIVLSEADYAAVQEPHAWQERFMRGTLDSHLCVFLGLSFTDPNLIRWVYRYSGDVPYPERHVAVFVRQGAPALGEQLRRSLERAAEARWRRQGIEVVWTDFFGELAQIVHEVVLKRSGSAAPSFGDRAKRFYEWASGLLVPPDETAFRTAQELLSDELSRILDDVRAAAATEGIDLSEETLGLGLWVVDHEAGTATIWATADRRLNDRSALVTNPLEYRSPWVGVDAVTQGVVVERDPAVYPSRWRLVRGIPIVLEEASGGEGRVIAGALTLTSMTPRANSLLSRAPRGVLGAIDGYLAEQGARLLAPVT